MCGESTAATASNVVVVEGMTSPQSFFPRDQQVSVLFPGLAELWPKTDARKTLWGENEIRFQRRHDFLASAKRASGLELPGSNQPGHAAEEFFSLKRTQSFFHLSLSLSLSVFLFLSHHRSHSCTRTHTLFLHSSQPEILERARSVALQTKSYVMFKTKLKLNTSIKQIISPNNPR